MISWSTRRSLEWCRIARGSGQPGDFDVPVIIVFAASDRAAWRRSIGIGIGAIVVYGSAPTAHSITAHCPPAHDEDSDITAHCPPAYDEDSDALAGAALGSPSVMSKSAMPARCAEQKEFDIAPAGSIAGGGDQFDIKSLISTISTGRVLVS
jgi:hypothetical protein